jgi:hypothetical protein
VPTILRSTKVLVAAAVALIVLVAAVLVVRDRSGQSGQVAQYVVPDTAGKVTGQAQVLTEALRKRGLVCSDLYPDYKPLLVRGCYRKDATHDVTADFAARPDGQLGPARFGIKYQDPADDERAKPDLEAIVGDFAAASAVRELTGLLSKNGQHSIAWGSVTVWSAELEGFGGMELEPKGWKWPDHHGDAFTGTAEQVAAAATADGFTCTSGGGPDVQNCDRGSDLVTAISSVDGIHTIGIRAGSWTAARALQEHIFGELTGDGPPIGDREPLATRWFAAGEAAGARAYVGGLQVCQAKYSSSTVFEITALVPFGDTDC